MIITTTTARMRQTLRSHTHAKLHHHGSKQTSPTHNRGWPHAKRICMRFEMLQQRVEFAETMINPNMNSVKIPRANYAGEQAYPQAAFEMRGAHHGLRDDGTCFLHWRLPQLSERDGSLGVLKLPCNIRHRLCVTFIVLVLIHRSSACRWYEPLCTYYLTDKECLSFCQ